MKYPKIETLFVRDETTRKVTTELRRPEFGIPRLWTLTEKVDGTNVRVMFDLAAGEVRIGGRTDNAQMPVPLLEHLMTTYTLDRIKEAFEPDTSGILFMEGYGPKIQAGGQYRLDVSTRLFDVVVYGDEGRPWWLNLSDVEDVARKLDVLATPVLETWSGSYLDDIKNFIVGLESTVAAHDSGQLTLAEGVVARTDPLLFDRRGNRVMWKLKAKDFSS